MTRRSPLGEARIGLGAAYGLSARGVRTAFDRGVRFYLWGALPKADFGAGLRDLCRTHRDELQIAVQSYARHGYTLRPGVELSLWRLGTDHLDWLCLANWHDPPTEDVLAAAQRLVERGLVRRLMISSHHRPTFATLARQNPPPFAAWMVRYNAAHRRAEDEVFRLTHAVERPAIIAYTALRWGTLLDPRYAPPGQAPLSATEAYRFVLSAPEVDLCLAGPRNEEELSAALSALDQGPLDEEGLVRSRLVGDAAHAFGRAQPPPRLRDVLRETPSLIKALWREGVTENLFSRFNR